MSDRIHPEHPDDCRCFHCDEPVARLAALTVVRLAAANARVEALVALLREAREYVQGACDQNVARSCRQDTCAHASLRAKIDTALSRGQP